MPFTTISSRALSRAVAHAKEATKSGPVFITNHGQHSHVLLSIEDYRHLTKQHRNIADALAMPGVAEMAFEPPRMVIGARMANVS